MASSRSDLAYLMRRAGFGATSSELDAFTTAGWDATVNSLLDFSQADPAADAVAVPPMSWYPRGQLGGAPTAEQQLTRQQFTASQRQQVVPLIGWWMQRMAVTAHPLREKLSLIWHNNFATAISKVQLPLLMYNQNQIFRTMGNGNFEDMTQSLAKDTAMMIWLDTQTDIATDPNENFAREMMERFTMGIGNYTEDDVRDGARCFTGWSIDAETGQYIFRPAQHDDGIKTYLGQTGNFNGEDAVHIATNSPASSTWVTSRLWSFLAYPVAQNDPVVKDLAPGYASDLNITNLVRNIFAHPMFTSTNARTGLVKQPIEWAVGMYRTLGIPMNGNVRLASALQQLGQVPFDPPNVGGWPENGYWLSTASSLARWHASEVAAEAARTGDISTVADAPVSGRLDAAADLLSIDSWSTTTASALQSVAANPEQFMTLAMVSPEYVSN